MLGGRWDGCCDSRRRGLLVACSCDLRDFIYDVGDIGNGIRHHVYLAGLSGYVILTCKWLEVAINVRESCLNSLKFNVFSKG